MKVLHIVPALFGNDGVVGGAERYVLELARYMSLQTPTSLVSFGEEGRIESVGELRIRVLGKPWYVRGQRQNPLSTGLLGEILQADVVHCHQQHILASSLAALLCRATGRRIFVTDLGGGGWDFSSYVSTDHWYDGHLHISEYSRRVFSHEGKTWAHVVLGGVDTAKFSPDSHVPRGDAVVFVGRLLAHKGIDDLIDAVPALMPLRVIGKAADPVFVEDLRRLAAGKRVTFERDASDDDLIDAYRRCICVVLPSVYRDRYGRETQVPELLGQTLLEGMACGAPVICTAVASMPEIVQDGVSGFIVPPNDPRALRGRLTWLTEHRDDAGRMGEQARKRVLEQFTWPGVVRRCLEIYRSTGR